MAGRLGRWAAILAVVLAGAGCWRAPPTHPSGTGADNAVKDFYGALVRQDWKTAYADLDSSTQTAYGPGRFAQLASAYRGRLGFEPEAVQIRSCEEHGTEAVAHLVIKGKAGGAVRSYKDAVSLRKAGTAWGVVWSPSLGQGR